MAGDGRCANQEFSQATSLHLRSLASLGKRMPAYRDRAKTNRQSLSGQAAITRSIFSAGT
jgi:hypothetical protein